MSRENATAAEILQSEVAQLRKQLCSTQDRLLQAQDPFKEDDSTLQQRQLHDAEDVHPTHGERNGPLSSNGKRILSRGPMLRQLQKKNEELRQQGSELRSEGNTHGMLHSEAEHLQEVLALSLWSLEMTVS
ncbi:unnamed protein product [Sphagnum troendelagicum]|uniref:Uncharacterized protein n=1 Tax=Sphagnum troendelagicum TaxID=128251 RepID=A0ABP0V020_9BRYO